MRNIAKFLWLVVLSITLTGCASASRTESNQETLAGWCAGLSSEIKDVDDAGIKFLFGYEAVFPDGNFIGTPFSHAVEAIMIKESKGFANYRDDADLGAAFGQYFLDFLGTKTSRECVSQEGNDLVAYIAEKMWTKG